MSDAGTVDESVDGRAARDITEHGPHAGRIRNVTDTARSLASVINHMLHGSRGAFSVGVHDVNRCAARRKEHSDCLPNAACAAGNDDILAIEAKVGGLVGSLAHRDTPRFQGMKSFCPKISALVRTVPLAT